jgi:hypothetical protein
MQVEEYYRPKAMAANSQAQINGIHMAGFLCTVAGTITVTDADGTVHLNAMPIGTGSVSIPLLFNTSVGAIVQLGGGAAGTLLT